MLEILALSIDKATDNMNLYETVVDLWALHQIYPNDTLNDDIWAWANMANPRQLRSLHTFFYRQNEPIHNALLWLMIYRIDILGQSCTPPIKRQSADILDQMILYSLYLNQYCNESDRIYINSIKRVVESSSDSVKISWKRYKKYLEFLRENDTSFLPNLSIMRFFSDQPLLLENLAYSEWIGEHYPALFKAAVTRMEEVNKLQLMRHQNAFDATTMHTREGLRRQEMTCIIESEHPDAPIEIKQESISNFMMLALLEFLKYALSLSGHSNFDTLDNELQNYACLLLGQRRSDEEGPHTIAYLLKRPNFQGRNINSDLFMKDMQFRSKRVLYILRQCTLEEQIRLITQMRLMGECWRPYQQSFELAFRTDPLWLSSPRPFLKKLTFLNNYATWMHLIRECTISKNELLPTLNFRLLHTIEKPASLLFKTQLIFIRIFQFYAGDAVADLFFSRESAHMKPDLYQEYHDTNPKLQQNFIEWLAPQRHLASSNLFSMFSGRPYSRAGEEEVWESNAAPHQ